MFLRGFLHDRPVCSYMCLEVEAGALHAAWL